MLETDTAQSESTLYVCRACGTGVRSPDQQSECPDCGGSLRDTTVPHD
jgi:rubrerythrin